MRNGKRVILHVASDSQHFAGVYRRFEKLSGYESVFLLMPKKEGHEDEDYFFIRDYRDRIVQAADWEEWKSYFSHPDVDIIYYWGVFPDFFKSVDSIGKDKIVILWVFGRDIYEVVDTSYPPILNVRLYKPCTFTLLNWQRVKRFHLLRSNLAYMVPNYDLLRGKIDRRALLKRADYIETPLPIECELIVKKLGIKARPFMLDNRGCEPRMPIVEHSAPGKILVNHSGALTNNHLDVLHVMRKVNLNGRDVVFPVNYGFGKGLLLMKMRKHKDLGGGRMVFLENILPLDEYQVLLKQTTHAVFGPLRQQALGNIFMCFIYGVKIFLYKDGILYKQFIKDGFKVFSIEKELNTKNLETPLSKEDAEYNNRLYYSLYGLWEGYTQKCFNDLFSE